MDYVPLEESNTDMGLSMYTAIDTDYLEVLFKSN